MKLPFTSNADEKEENIALVAEQALTEQELSTVVGGYGSRYYDDDDYEDDEYGYDYERESAYGRHRRNRRNRYFDDDYGYY